MKLERLNEIRRKVADRNICWNEQALAIAKDLLAEVDMLDALNGRLQSIASNGWVEAWHSGNQFMALPPDDDHSSVLRCWQESDTLKQIQGINSKFSRG